MNKKTIRDIDLAGQRVLVRVDFNVPIEKGEVTDGTRISAAVPTLQAILEAKPRYVALMSHLGRPKGGPEPKYSLKPVLPVLESYLGVSVAFAEDCVGEAAEQAAAALPEGGVIVLENTRFHPEEEKNDAEFSAKLARLGDVYVNDAFGSSHRAHASVEGVAHHLPAVAGLLMEKEITFLAAAVANPQRPFAAILGGAKISDKIAVIENLLTKADKILIGGGMANTFLKAQGIEMGASLVEAEALETAAGLMQQAGGKILLPVDAVVAEAFDAAAKHKVIRISQGVPEGWRMLDIGPETVDAYKAALADCMTIVWNGPMGVFEMEPFSQGTWGVAGAVADRTAAGAVTVIGGGDSAAAVNQAGLEDQVTHVSTGGGASLELLEGKVLPGLAALNDK